MKAGQRSARRIWALRVTARAAAMLTGVVLPLAGTMLQAVPSAASASVPITSGDRLATRSFLEAQLAYARAVAARTPASKAAVEQLAQRLSSECPNALADAPPAYEPLRERATESLLPPRARGEASRQSRQRSDLAAELFLAFSRAAEEPMRKAALAFAHAVERLAWSSAPLTSYEHSKAASIEWELRIPPPEVCVDVEAWVKSGYQILSATTKSLADEDTKYNEAFALAVERGHVSVSRFENRSDRTLSKAIVALGQQTLRSRERIRSLEAKVAGKLDLLSREEAAILDIRPQARSVVIHRGSTAAGARYAVRVLPKRSSDDDLGQACAVTLETQESSSGRHAGNSALSNICLSRSHLQPPTVRCIRGLLEVTSQVPPRTRSVSLRLSNGHQIVSRVAIVPAKLGGPLGFYFQMVPGPSPIPVSLTELDGQGRAIGTVGLSSKVGCVAPKPHLKALELSRRLAQGVAPGGLSFLLLGELSGRGRLQEADIELQAPGRRRLLIASQSLSEESLRVPRTIGKASKPLFWEVATGCQPNQYAILYGVSTDPADTVLARTSEGLVALRKVKIPRALHIPGVLAYASFNGVPSEVVVKTPAGATIVHESLALRVDETREFCEGEAEP